MGYVYINRFISSYIETMHTTLSVLYVSIDLEFSRNRNTVWIHPKAKKRQFFNFSILIGFYICTLMNILIIHLPVLHSYIPYINTYTHSSTQPLIHAYNHLYNYSFTYLLMYTFAFHPTQESGGVAEWPYIIHSLIHLFSHTTECCLGGGLYEKWPRGERGIEREGEKISP